MDNHFLCDQFYQLETTTAQGDPHISKINKKWII